MYTIIQTKKHGITDDKNKSGNVVHLGILLYINGALIFMRLSHRLCDC